jgi:hypothetical protein
VPQSQIRLWRCKRRTGVEPATATKMVPSLRCWLVGMSGPDDSFTEVVDHAFGHLAGYSRSGTWAGEEGLGIRPRS